MKTWLTYLAASAMGLALELVFKDSVVFASLMESMTRLAIQLGIFTVFPLVLFSMTAGTASLTRKKGANSFVWVSTLFWALFTTVALSVAGALVFRIFPAAFPATSTTVTEAEQAAQLYRSMTTSTATRLSYANPVSVNAFINLFKSSDCLLPLILLAMVFGYAFRPTSEIIRPAYITLNSISEALFRLARKISQLMWILIFFIAGCWYETLYIDGTVFFSWQFVTMFLAVGIGVLFVIIPLLYAIATGFRRNPYRQIGRLFSASTAAFFSGNYLFSQTSLYTDCRVNLGIQKSVVSTALPLHSILTKGGTALVSTICTCSLIQAVNGTVPTAIQTITIALACTLVSYICFLHAGYEVVFATAFALNLLKVDISGAEFAIIGILPMINGTALLFDVMLSGLGTSFTAFHLKADCRIAEKDTV